MPYVVGDVAKSSSLCIWEGEGGRTRRSFHTRLCVFQVFRVLLRGGCVCVWWEGMEMEYTYSLMCPITLTAPRSAAKMAYKLSQIIKFMIGQNCNPRCWRSLTFALPPAWLFSLIAWSAFTPLARFRLRPILSTESFRVQKMAKKLKNKMLKDGWELSSAKREVSNKLLKKTLSYFSTWDRNVSSLVHNSQSDYEIYFILN